MSESQAKTFIEYQEYDLNESYTIIHPIATRDIQHPDFKKHFEGGTIPSEFRFFDADVTTVDGESSYANARNYSAPHVMAERIMTVEEFKNEQLPQIEKMKKDKGGLLTRLFNMNRPVMAWYIDGVKATLLQAKAAQSAYIAETSKGAYYTAVVKDMIVIDQSLQRLFPVAPKAQALSDQPKP
jgi:hypothetical protein